MGESLLEIRHPELDRLYAVWRLLCAFEDRPPISAADPNVLRDWQEHVVIVHFEESADTHRQIHVGDAIAGGNMPDLAISSVNPASSNREPFIMEDTDSHGQRWAMLLLPFGRCADHATRVVAAIFPSTR